MEEKIVTLEKGALADLKASTKVAIVTFNRPDRVTYMDNTLSFSRSVYHHNHP